LKEETDDYTENKSKVYIINFNYTVVLIMENSRTSRTTERSRRDGKERHYICRDGTCTRVCMIHTRGIKAAWSHSADHCSARTAAALMNGAQHSTARTEE